MLAGRGQRLRGAGSPFLECPGGGTAASQEMPGEHRREALLAKALAREVAGEQGDVAVEDVLRLSILSLRVQRAAQGILPTGQKRDVSER
jgi:hypothetical protein